MKQINIYLEDSEHKRLSKKKGDLPWKEFFIKATEEYDESRKPSKK